MWIYFNESRIFAHGSNIKGFLHNSTSFNIGKVLGHNHVVLWHILLFYFISECGSPQLRWSPSLAENSIQVIQVTYSESWLGSSEFFLRPKQRQAGAANFPDSLSLYHIFQVAVRLSQERGLSGRCGRLDLAKGWAGQAGRPWMRKSHALLHQPVTPGGNGRIISWLLLLWKCKCWNRLWWGICSSCQHAIFTCCV